MFKINYKIILLFLLLFAFSLKAEDFPNIDVQNFKNNPFDDNFLTVFASTPQSLHTFHFSLFTDVQKDPLLLSSKNDKTLRHLVAFRQSASFSTAFSLFSWLDFAIDIPFIVYQKGDAWPGASELAPTAINDISFISRINFYRQKENLFSISFIPEIFFPTGQLMSYSAGSSSVVFKPVLALESKFSIFDTALNLSYKILKNQKVAGTTIGDEAGIDFSVVSKINNNFDFIAELLTKISVKDDFKTKMESNFALKLKPNDKWNFIIGGGNGILKGFGVPAFRAFLGASYNLSVKSWFVKKIDPTLDTDGDGIPDIKDKCPTQKEVFNNFKDDDGCPDFVKVVKKYEKKKHKFVFKGNLKEKKIDVVLYFGLNSTMLSDDAILRLDNVVAEFKNNKKAQGIKILVYKYKDEQKDVALQRSIAIQNYFVKHGIPPYRIKTQRKKATGRRAKDDNSSKRVEFFVIE